MQRLSGAALAAILLPTLATAQVTYGTDDASNQDNFRLDIATGTSVGPEWTDGQTWGMADDDAAALYYVNGGTPLAVHPFASSGMPATVLGSMMMPGGTATFNCTGMAYHNGTLYGHRNISVEGLYDIDLVTLEATLLFAYTTTSIDLGGLDFDPATGLLYASEDSSSYSDPMGNSGPGVLVLDVATASESLMFPYPPGETDIDGLAFDPTGAGSIYLLEDEPAPIHRFDLGTMAFDPAPAMNSILGNEIFSAGTYTGGGSGGGLGTQFCMANPNSTGATGAISATGTTSVAANNFTLHASDLPANAFGFFITSQTQAFVANPNGSEGNLCLGGAIGRYVGAGQIQNSGAGGSFSLGVDLTMHPTPTGLVSVAGGETWNFQAWHRDSGAIGPTSNFTNGLEVDFVN